MTNPANLHSNSLQTPFLGLGNKQRASSYQKQFTKEDLDDYLSQVALRDSDWWQTTKKLAAEAKRFANVNWDKSYLEPQAQTVLIAAYCYTRPDANQKQEIVGSVQYLLQKLPAIERGRLAKILALIPGEEGKLFRRFLYPMIYHCREASDIPSDQELLKEAIEIVRELDKCSPQVLARLNLPVLSEFQADEQKKLIAEWKATLLGRENFLKKGYEILFPRYYARYFPEGETELTTSFPQEEFEGVHDCYSVNIEGLNTMPSSPSKLDYLEGVYKVMLCSKCHLPNLIPEKNLSTVTYLAVNHPNKFESEKRYWIVKKSIAQLDEAFLKGRLPSLIPLTWSPPNQIDPRPMAIPSKNRIAQKILELNAPKKWIPTTPNVLTSSSDELTIDE